MNKWREVNMKKLQKICDEEGVSIKKVSTKDKRGRFDVSFHKGANKNLIYKVLELEKESYDMCMTCGKVSKQYRFNKGWTTHHCWKHLIGRYIKWNYRRIIYFFKR